MSSRAANKVAGGIADISVKMADSIIKHLGGKSSRYGEELSDPQKKPHAAKEIAGTSPPTPLSISPLPSAVC